jgi:hypothetical protein
MGAASSGPHLSGTSEPDKGIFPLRVGEGIDSGFRIQDFEWMQSIEIQGFVSMEFGIFHPIRSHVLSSGCPVQSLKFIDCAEGSGKLS